MEPIAPSNNIPQPPPAAAAGTRDDVAGRIKAQPDQRPHTASDFVTTAVATGDLTPLREESGLSFLALRRGAGVDVVPLSGAHVKDLLAGYWEQRFGTFPSAKVAGEVARQLRARAAWSRPQRLWLRVGRHGDRIYVDLNDPDRRVVEIDRDGHRLVTNPPVYFQRRPTGTLPVPRDGDIGLLRDLLPFLTADQFYLLLGWLLVSYLPDGLYFGGSVTGPQGSGKSILVRILGGLVDPTGDSLTDEVGAAVPMGAGDLAVGGVNSHVYIIDNVSMINREISDMLCLFSTGGGLRKRRLHTDADECNLRFRRPTLIAGLGGFVSRADLLSRLLHFDLEPIAASAAVPEDELANRYDRDRPAILGALYKMLSGGLRCYKDTQVDWPAGATNVRMVTAARWVCACFRGVGLDPGLFLGAYCRMTEEHAEDPFESWVLAPYMGVVADMKFRGRATELLAELNKLALVEERLKPSWPTNAMKLSAELHAFQDTLAQNGISARKRRTAGGKSKVWEISRLPAASQEPVAVAALTA